MLPKCCNKVMEWMPCASWPQIFALHIINISDIPMTRTQLLTNKPLLVTCKLKLVHIGL